MKASSSNVAVAMLACSFAFLFMTVGAAPMMTYIQDPEEEQGDNSLVGHSDNEGEMSRQWDPINTAALRKLLLQLDADDRMVRGSRSWPATEPRGWGLRNIDGRLARQWRADKRQVRFRQCYFNPISCFRK